MYVCITKDSNVYQSLCANFFRITLKIRITRSEITMMCATRYKDYCKSTSSSSSTYDPFNSVALVTRRHEPHSEHFALFARFFNAIASMPPSVRTINSSFFARGKTHHARTLAKHAHNLVKMFSRFCRRHHLSRRKAPCITSGVYPRSRHPVVTTHLLSLFPPLPPAKPFHRLLASRATGLPLLSGSFARCSSLRW